MGMILEDDDGCEGTWDAFPVTWVQGTVVGTGSRDCVICASGRASGVPFCMATSFSSGCTVTLDCCIAVEGGAFDGESTNAVAG